MNSNTELDEFDERIEALFERADDLMINKKDFGEAVSWERA